MTSADRPELSELTTTRIGGPAGQYRRARSQQEIMADITQAASGVIGIRSFAHWVAYACEMTPHTAREYIRVARGLRELPEVARLFGEGHVSYSKVREITRLAGPDDPER